MDVTPDSFVSQHDDATSRLLSELRSLVLREVPDAIERVQIGWGTLGFRIAVGKKSRQFAVIYEFERQGLPGVKLAFADASAAIDSHDLLEQTGSQMQFIWLPVGQAIGLAKSRAIREILRSIASSTRGELTS